MPKRLYYYFGGYFLFLFGVIFSPSLPPPIIFFFFGVLIKMERNKMTEQARLWKCFSGEDGPKKGAAVSI